MKKTNFQHTPRYLNNAHAAANEANKYAHNASLYREKYYYEQSILQHWSHITANAPITLYNCVFCFCFIVDIFISWEMYRDLVAYLLPATPWWATLTVALFINGLACVVAHFGSKAMSASMIEIEAFNLTYLKNNGNYAPELAQKDIRTQANKELFGFVVSGLGLLGIVFLISWQRTFLMGQIHGSETSVEDYDFFQKILPLIAVICEIFTGIFLVFSIKKYHLERSCRKNKKLFEENLYACIEHDQLASDLLQRAKDNAEEIILQKNLKNSLFRLTSRPTNDHYIDEVYLYSAFFEIKNFQNNPVEFAHVMGYFEDGQITSAAFTDKTGKVALHWRHQAERLKIISVNGTVVEGPFVSDMNHTIQIALPVARQHQIYAN